MWLLVFAYGSPKTTKIPDFQRPLSEEQRKRGNVWAPEACTSVIEDDAAGHADSCTTALLHLTGQCDTFSIWVVSCGYRLNSKSLQNFQECGLLAHAICMLHHVASPHIPWTLGLLCVQNSSWGVGLEQSQIRRIENPGKQMWGILAAGRSRIAMKVTWILVPCMELKQNDSRTSWNWHEMIKESRIEQHSPW